MGKQASQIKKLRNQGKKAQPEASKPQSQGQKKSQPQPKQPIQVQKPAESKPAESKPAESKPIVLPPPDSKQPQGQQVQQQVQEVAPAVPPKTKPISKEQKRKQKIQGFRKKQITPQTGSQTIVSKLHSDDQGILQGHLAYLALFLQDKMEQWGKNRQKQLKAKKINSVFWFNPLKEIKKGWFPVVNRLLTQKSGLVKLRSILTQQQEPFENNLFFDALNYQCAAWGPQVTVSDLLSFFKMLIVFYFWIKFDEQSLIQKSFQNWVDALQQETLTKIYQALHPTLPFIYYPNVKQIMGKRVKSIQAKKQAQKKQKQAKVSKMQEQPSVITPCNDCVTSMLHSTKNQYIQGGQYLSLCGLCQRKVYARFNHMINCFYKNVDYFTLTAQQRKQTQWATCKNVYPVQILSVDQANQISRACYQFITKSTYPVHAVNFAFSSFSLKKNIQVSKIGTPNGSVYPFVFARHSPKMGLMLQLFVSSSDKPLPGQQIDFGCRLYWDSRTGQWTSPHFKFMPQPGKVSTANFLVAPYQMSKTWISLMRLICSQVKIPRMELPRRKAIQQDQKKLDLDFGFSDL